MFFHMCYFRNLSHEKHEMCIILLLMITSVFVDNCSTEAITSSVGKAKIHYNIDNNLANSTFTDNIFIFVFQLNYN